MAQPQFLFDEEGHKKYAVLRIEDYNHLIEMLEDIEDIKDVTQRMANPELIEFDEVKKQLGL